MVTHLPAPVYDVAGVRELDRRAQAHGLDADLLMARAGASAFAFLRARWPRARTVCVVCGSGNNGGDGYVVAAEALAAGLLAEALEGAPPHAGAAARARERFVAAGGRARAFDDAALARADVVVDALLGTGVRGPLSPEAAARVQAMNACARPVLALDVPSGLDADRGVPCPIAVHARATVTFVGLKLGLLTGRAPDHVGLLAFDDLGVPRDPTVAPRALRLRREESRGLVPARARSVHKGDAGRVLVIGGNVGMGGAARLAGEAAYRAGAGLVTLATHPSHAACVAAARPELLSFPLASKRALVPLLARADAVALGVGLGRDAWARAAWAAVLESDKPLVVDADALNLLAAHPCRRDDWVITPHPGEAARLLGGDVEAIETDRPSACRALSERYGGTCVLKGAGTLIAHANDLWVCDVATPALATGGSGDVLTGVIAALRAQGLDGPEAARLGVYLHARAGLRVTERGARGALASDLLAPLRAELHALAGD